MSDKYVEKWKQAHINAEKVFAKIFARFPNLQVIENKDDPVEISYTFPVQEGLKYKVWLCLQNNDELHLGVENFWVSWFSCAYEEVVQKYEDAVIKFLSGENRIVEYYNGKRCAKAILQRFENGEWVNGAGSLHAFSALGFWKRKTQKIIQSI